MAIDLDSDVINDNEETLWDDKDIYLNRKTEEKEEKEEKEETEEPESIHETFLEENAKISFEEFRDMQTYFINLVLFVAKKQDTEEDKRFFILVAFYMYVKYLLFFHETLEEKDDDYLQLGGVKEWILRNGETMKVDENDIQKGDVPLSVAGGFREGNKVVQYSKIALGESERGEVVVPEQMFRDTVSSQLNNQQQQLAMQLQNLQFQEQMMATENRIREMQRNREMLDLTYDERRRVLEGTIPYNEIATALGVSVAAGFGCCIFMETSRTIISNQVQNITTGVADLATGAINSVTTAATSEYVPKGATALGRLFYNVGSSASENVAFAADYLSEFFINPVVAQTIVEGASQIPSDSIPFVLKNESFLEGIWSQCKEGISESTSRTSFNCGMMVAACSLCCLYRQSAIRANDTKRKLVLGPRMYAEEQEANQKNFNNAAKMVVTGAGIVGSIVGGPVVGVAANTLGTILQSQGNQRAPVTNQSTLGYNQIQNPDVRTNEYQATETEEAPETSIEPTHQATWQDTGLRKRKTETTNTSEKGGKITKKRQARKYNTKRKKMGGKKASKKRTIKQRKTRQIKTGRRN